MLNRPFGKMKSFAANRLLRSFSLLGKLRGFCYTLFRERLSEKVHATMSIQKGIVGGFELTVLQKNLKECHVRP